MTARPQVGRAGQAIDQRRTVEICSTVAIPYSSSQLLDLGAPGRLEVGEQDRLLAGQPRRRPVLLEERPQAARKPVAALVLDPAVLDRDAQKELAVTLRVPAEVVVDVGDLHRPRDRRAAGRGTPRPWPGRRAGPSRE